MIPSLENFVAEICRVIMPEIEYQNVAPHFDVFIFFLLTFEENCSYSLLMEIDCLRLQ
jgi:hypothetical protein